MYLLSVTYAAIYGLTIVCSLQQAMLARCKNEIAECQGGICPTAGDACQWLFIIIDVACRVSTSSDIQSIREHKT